MLTGTVGSGAAFTTFHCHIDIVVKRPLWRYLSKQVDPDRQILVFLRGQLGNPPKESWVISVTSRSDLPEEAESQGFIGVLGKYPFLVVQRPHLHELDGQTLNLKAGQRTDWRVVSHCPTATGSVC